MNASVRTTTSAAAEHFRRDGFVVLPALYDRSALDAFGEALERCRRAIGSPPLYARTPQRPLPNMEVSSTGLVFVELLGWAPELAPHLLHPEALAVVREVLGEDMRLELVGGVMTDESRPFFEWHHHVGGPDDETLRKRGGGPRIVGPSERLSYLVYLDEVTLETGPLLFHPRREGALLVAPEPVERQRWSGDVAVTFPAGSVVLIEQCTWHAVPQRALPGRRAWVGAYFASGSASPAEREDASLAVQTDPLLRSVLRESSGG